MSALSGNSSATLHRISGGTHVDLESGRLHFSSPANSSVAVHAIDALLRAAKNQPTRARVRSYTQRMLQVSAIHGDLVLTPRSMRNPRTHRIQQRSGKPGQAVRNELGLADPLAELFGCAPGEHAQPLFDEGNKLAEFFFGRARSDGRRRHFRP